MQRILILLPNNLGDVIMTLPVLAGIKKNNSQSRITFFVEDGFEGGIEKSLDCDRIYKFPRKVLRDSSLGNEWKKGISHLTEIIEDLRAQGFDSVINLSQHPYLSYIVSLLRVEDVKGGVMLKEGNLALRDPWSQYLYTIPFSRAFNRFHATDIYKKIAGVHGISESSILLTQNEKENAHKYLQNKGVAENSRLIVFQPGAAYYSKRWPVENFIALGKMLVKDGYHILITGAPSERDIGSGIFENLPDNCSLLSGELTFRETIAVTSLCEFCVTGDTALMHAASALQKKVYTVFGSTNPVETGPYGTGHIVFAGRCTTRPCFCKECKTKLCMKSILPEAVYKIISDTQPNGTNLGCDVYQTEIDQDGLYCLQPICGTNTHFFNDTGASITGRAFDQSIKALQENDDYLMYKDESEQTIAVIKKMEEKLQQYLLLKNSESIRSFELHKKELSSIKGIGEFWSALLNIRLNSVQVLDIEMGIAESCDVCIKTREQIESAFSV
jgi:ADP-heptose:LPS heptosyltransferase